jgi:N-acetylglucosaminyldiphosphoundecaprenol N-acetyl-beta-D-mannosaminyltransferase
MLKTRVPGIELMEECLKIANANNQKVFLLGAKNDVLPLIQFQVLASSMVSSVYLPL